MTDFTDYESQFDNNQYSYGWCQCGTPMREYPTDDPMSDETELLCPYCDAEAIEDRTD
jgi:hypothetical protein